MSSKPTAAAKPMRVAFIHPDLGIGGAERLVVDAAAELVKLGHHVDMYTAYYNPARCFEETRTGGFAVLTAGTWFPRHIFNRMLALCAYIRCILVALYVAWRCRRGGAGSRYDVIFADAVSVVVPVVRALMPRTKVLFYCHFPDLLLAQRGSAIKRLYRAPLDYIEQVTTGKADLVLVNSNFTRGIFAQTFKRLAARGVDPMVLYPAVVTPPAAELEAAASAWQSELDEGTVEFIKQGTTFLSINRFERKKGIGLALEALHVLAASYPAAKPRIIVAGGYDERLAENREHMQELKDLTARLELRDRVIFMPSFTDRERTLLLAASAAVIYTPQHEHFGIVPLEAMSAGRPVIACNNGGPTESVPHGVGGLLCEPTAAAFAEAMGVVLDRAAAARMGAAARRHVEDKFSRAAFGRQLQGYLQGLLAGGAAAAAAAPRAR